MPSAVCWTCALCATAPWGCTSGFCCARCPKYAAAPIPGRIISGSHAVMLSTRTMLGLAAALSAVIAGASHRPRHTEAAPVPAATVHHAAAFDISPPLASLSAANVFGVSGCGSVIEGCGLSPPTEDDQDGNATPGMLPENV